MSNMSGDIAAIRSVIEFFTGPLAIQPLSSLLYGMYTGLVYFTPLLGGWLADRALGQKRVVVLGILLMAFGHFMMAFESLLFPALFLLVIGVGIFKPNTTSQVGSLYAPGDHRRDRAYSIFYVGINVGAFLSPLVCGSLGENVGWHYGFGAAGVGMLIALAVYLPGLKTLPEDELTTYQSRTCRGTASDAKRAPVGTVADPADPAVDALLGLLRTAGQHDCACGRRTTPTAASICCSGVARSM